MIRDAKLILSNEQAVTTTADSSILDLNAAGDMSDLWLEISVPVSATADGSATVAFSVITATDEAFSSPITLLATSAIGKADLAAGDKALKVKLPVGVLRYLKVTYTVASGPLTAGKFNAFLTPGVENVGSFLR